MRFQELYGHGGWEGFGTVRGGCEEGIRLGRHLEWSHWSGTPFVRWCRDGDYVGLGGVLVPVFRWIGSDEVWILPSDWTVGAGD